MQNLMAKMYKNQTSLQQDL